MPTKRKGLSKPRPWSVGALRTLHRLAPKGTTVQALARMLKRTEGAVRQKARHHGLSVGVHQRGVATSRKRIYAARRLGL